MIELIGVEVQNITILYQSPKQYKKEEKKKEDWNLRTTLAFNEKARPKSIKKWHNPMNGQALGLTK